MGLVADGVAMKGQGGERLALASMFCYNIRFTHTHGCLFDVAVPLGIFQPLRSGLLLDQLKILKSKIKYS